MTSERVTAPGLGGGRHPIGSVLMHLGLIIAALAFVFPFIWMVLTSLKTLSQLLNAPLSFWPDPWTIENYVKSWNAVPFPLAYWNSFYIAALTVVGTLITSAMAAYGFARIPFRGGKVLFVVFLATQMIPKQVTLIPTYVVMSSLGWVDSHLAIIVPGMLVNPFAVFLMRQFILSLPIELEEAAMIDGAGRFRTFFSVILPNLRSGMGALAIIVALDAWNNFLLPLVLFNSSNLFTVPLLLSQFQGQFAGVNYGLIMAASAVSTIPMLIVFIIAQRHILDSMASSGLGGK